MDSTLLSSWKDASAPFDGVTVRDGSEGEITLQKLRQVSLEMVHILEECFPESSLLVLDDWHEHDGYVSTNSPTTWAELRKRFSTAEGFLYFRTGDFEVSKGLYPLGRKFYLRVYVDEGSSSEEGAGDIDVTVPLQFAGRISEVFKVSGLTPKTESAKAYFDRRYGG